MQLTQRNMPLDSVARLLTLQSKPCTCKKKFFNEKFTTPLTQIDLGAIEATDIFSSLAILAFSTYLS